VVILGIASAYGCSTLGPGAHFPKTASAALPHPEETKLGGQFAAASHDHGDTSGFRIISVGLDGFLARMQMIDAAERTIDLQYFIYHSDETGKLITAALLRAAERGVRVRVLIDDGATEKGDEQIFALDAHPLIEIRVFNPFSYRGHATFLRTVEFMFNASRLDYRMHNKLLVVDNAVGLVGGRNIGKQYFQVDPESQFADDDVFSAGPVAMQLSATFDEYWNSAFAIPAEALKNDEREEVHSPKHKVNVGQELQSLQKEPIDYAKQVATGEPFSGIIAGRLPLVWAQAKVIADSPDKRRVEKGDRSGRLMTRTVMDTAKAVQSELLMITPYFVPADEDLQILKDLRAHDVRVRILTNSLESNLEVSAHAGYQRYRKQLLTDGIELHEVRSLLGNTRGSGQTATISHYGNYSLHAKYFVFDRQKLFMGSMNFDQRSKRLNTEVGVIIDSKELAQQTALRFEAMTQPENSYSVGLPPTSTGSSPRLVWTTREDDQHVEYVQEPARSEWQRFKLMILSLLPISAEL
jgi:putative cardiolipin synthase